MVCGTSAAEAQTSTSTTTARAVVAQARNAFEYRDFETVVKLLHPWVHPPTIVDPKLMLQARRLLGVSQFVLGNEKAAEEEFGQLLLLNPLFRLDPFEVPPRVIARFEEIRSKMRKARAGPGALEPDGPVKTKVVFLDVPHWSVTLLPLGIPQFAMDSPKTGVMWLLLQVTGIVVNVVAYQQTVCTQNCTDRNLWIALQYGGLGLTAAGWIGSSIHAQSIYQEHKMGIIERAKDNPRFDEVEARLPPLPPTINYSFRF